MQADYVDSSPLARSFVTSVVHMSFPRAVRQIGLPEFLQPLFLSGITPYLRRAEHLSHENMKSLLKLGNSVLRGEVIATDVWRDALVFYVRGGYGTTGIVVRILFQKNQWRIESLVSVYERSVVRTVWFRRGAMLASVVLAAVVGFALHQQPAPAPSNGMTISAATAQATEKLLAATARANAKPATQTDKPGSHATSPGAAISVRKPTVHSRVGSTKAGQAVVSHASGSSSAQALRFTLSEGTPLFNLAQFLADHHVVTNAVSFDMTLKKTGVDQDVQPGTYVFRRGMSVSQVLHVIKQGPSK